MPTPSLQPSKLQLEESVLESIVFHTALPIDGQHPETDEVIIASNTAFEQNEKIKHVWRVTLQVEFYGADDKRSKYSGKVRLLGKFAVDPESPEEQQHRLIATNAPSLLYGMIRELVANLTSRGAHGTYFLPTLVFPIQTIRMATKEEIESPLLAKRTGRKALPQKEKKS